MGNAPDIRKPPPSETCLLVYDGQCRLCVGVKRRLERAGLSQPGSGLRFAPYDSHEARQALGNRYRPGRPDVAFFISQTGQVRQGLDAFMPLLPQLPGGRAFHWLLGFGLVRTAAEWAYHVVARHRYRIFGKADQAGGPR
ncbi:MAG: DUF393 domain-containing protein [Nitrospiraceae bacterium]|nr:DUF393 domain-containing protein [Nitrospiraceae bacterium]